MERSIYDSIKRRIISETIDGRKLVYAGKRRISFGKRTSVCNKLRQSNEELYKDIVECTSFLKGNVDIFQRIKCILLGISNHEKCKICGKPAKLNSGKKFNVPMFKLTCSKSCSSKMAASKRKTTESSRENHRKAQIAKKKDIEDLCKNIYDKYSKKEFNLKTIKEIKEYAKSKESNRNGNGTIIPVSDMISKVDEICSLLEYTKFKKIPKRKEIKYSSFGFTERCYCAARDIAKQTLCEFCGSNPAKFISSKIGYARNCNRCHADLARKNKGYPTLGEMKNMIEEGGKYTVESMAKNAKEPIVVRCKKCGNLSNVRIYNGRGKYLKEHELCETCREGSSNGECEIRKYLESLPGVGKAKPNDRTAISPYELDLYFKDKNIAIEYDGLYWHNDKRTGKLYHLKKTELCEQNGIRLVHIFEDEWMLKKDIVKSRLKHIFCKTKKRIYARNCEVKEIDSLTKDRFMEKYHIQGTDKSSVRFGLFKSGKLVAVMTFCKSRFNKNYEWELSRYATISNFEIVGGAGKLLKYFERTISPDSLITYADRRWSQGNLYEATGFSLIGKSNPNYWYIPKDFSCRRNRIEFQKGKLKGKLPLYDERLSEKKNMENNGYTRIYDCGNLVYAKRYKK